MAASAARPVAPENQPAGRRRLARGEREQRIVEEAARLFASEGFRGSTRALASRLGVTQALLYRYFPRKDALIERVFERIFSGLEDRARPELLTAPGVPLEERLARFYLAYLEGASELSVRLFVRASLDGLDLARRYGAPLTERVLVPVVRALRDAAGLADLDRLPLARGERELAMALHGGLMFLHIRKHVYGMPMPDALEDLVALHIRAFVPGALIEIRRLHERPVEDGFAVRQLARRRR